jgi:plastocyanin
MTVLGRSIGSAGARGALILATLALGLFAVAGSVSAADPTAISIVDRSFDPADATIHVGDTITWTVTKAIADPHSVTSGKSGDPDQGKVFDSKLTLRNNGDTFSFTFPTAGTFGYFCIVHPAQMHGTIQVLAPGQTAGSAASAAPATSAGPEASPGPGAPEGGKAPVSTADKLIAAGILGAALVILFGAATLYRRVNR